MTLYPHQQKFVDANPPKALLAWEMRTGKTLPATLWIDHPSQAGNTYIITPKQNKKDWQSYGTKATVLTKEEFKKVRAGIVRPTAIVVDEAHYFASALFLKGRSQLATALYTLLQEYPECHVLLLTATPVRQDAWSLHTLLCYIGVYHPWKVWREEFFVLTRLPFLRFPAYMPRVDWRTNIRKYLEAHCNIVSLRDVVDYLPPTEPIFIQSKPPPHIRKPEEVIRWTDLHQHEQLNKDKEILKLGQGYRKILVVAHYTEQIDFLAAELSRDKPTFVLNGHTKDPAATLKAAQEADDCYFIVQSSMGFGFDGWMFSAMVFASMSHSCLNHTQMLGRMRHLEHLKIVTPYYLFGGPWDKKIYDTIKKGKDFNPHEYKNDPTLFAEAD